MAITTMHGNRKGTTMIATKSNSNTTDYNMRNNIMFISMESSEIIHFEVWNEAESSVR